MPAVFLPRSRGAAPLLAVALAALFGANAKAADVYQPYGRYPPPPPPAVLPEAEVSEEMQIERRAPLPPVAEAPLAAERCKVIVRRRINEFGEPVVRRIRICDEVVRGPAPGWGEPLRRDVYGGTVYGAPPAPVPLPPRDVGPDEFEEGEPG